MKKDGISDFTKLFQLNYTLKFELEPVGRTRENLEKSGLLAQDRKRADAYIKVKSLLDEQHKKFLQKVLSQCDLDWLPLAEKLKEYQRDRQNRKALEDAQAEYRKKIVKCLEADKIYETLTETTPKNLFNQMLQDPASLSADVKI